MSSQGLPDDALGSASHSEKQQPANILSFSALGGTSRPEDVGELLPRSKWNACTVCKTTKLRCDGGNPCGTCTRLNHDCTYVDSRRKSRPKRSYAQGLEARLAELEKLLKQKESSNVVATPAIPSSLKEPSNNFETLNSGSGNLCTGDFITVPDIIESNSLSPMIQDSFFTMPIDEGVSWEMIGLGLEEPLPPQSTIDALTDIYFTKIHPACPIIHQIRFLMAADLLLGIQSSIALRYAMWMLAASSSEEYKSSHAYFYTQARKYAEADENAGKFWTVQHAQAWLLIALYEFKMMHFPNATMTTTRAIRLTQIMGLNKVDGPDSVQPMDWIDKEERRRSFWMAFIFDRYASVGTGWPMVIDERDIFTNLPSSEEAYALNEGSQGISLTSAMLPENATSLSSFAGVIVIACIRGRTLAHLQRHGTDDDDRDLNGEFWTTHRKLDNILLNTSLYLPPHLRLPASSFNANVVFMNMNLQSAIITLNQTAIFKAEKLGLPANIAEDCMVRCVTAAKEIATITKMIAHVDLSALSIFTPFSLYVAIRTFSQFLKNRPDDDNARSSSQFLLSALLALKVTCPLAESNLIQLDLEGIGLSALQKNVRFSSGGENSATKLSSEDSPWVTFISPLVRIVEEEGDSAPVSGNTASAAPFIPSVMHPPASLDPVNMSSASDDYGNVLSDNVYHDQQLKDLIITQMEFDAMNMPVEMFDSFGALEANNWEGF